ncbi:isocitrate lyase/PEP mutase family protein [Rhodococcus sp. IEGM 248]|jgi:methylisocitrate lyase|nr:isocitrate lyase/PEP mutase family protein [Rhodococcus sp. IEGM 248]
MSANGITPKTVSPARRLRELLAGEGLVQIPGIYDPFSARAAQELGFEAVALGGGVTVSVAYHVVPDMTMISTRDVIDVARGITRAIDIPLIVDFDDGGGNPLQVRHAVQLAEAAGIAGVMIEDTDFTYPKHTPPKELGKLMQFKDNHHLSREAAVQRIRAAVEARRNPDTVIIARTDGALISKEESLVRMRLLAEAGADVIKPTHFPFEDAAEAVEACGRPVMMVPIRLGSSTAQELEHARRGGVKLLLEPVPVSYAIYGAVINTLAELKSAGTVAGDHSDTVKFVQETIRYPEWGDLATRYQG